MQRCHCGHAVNDHNEARGCTAKRCTANGDWRHEGVCYCEQCLCYCTPAEASEERAHCPGEA